MGDGDRNPNASRGDLQLGAMKDLPGFVHHFHFLFAVAIIEEHVNLGDAGLRDVIGIKLRRFAFLATFQIIETFFAASAASLIRRIKNPRKSEGFIKRL